MAGALITYGNNSGGSSSDDDINNNQASHTILYCVIRQRASRRGSLRANLNQGGNRRQTWNERGRGSGEGEEVGQRSSLFRLGRYWDSRFATGNWKLATTDESEANTLR